MRLRPEEVVDGRYRLDRADRLRRDGRRLARPRHRARAATSRSRSCTRTSPATSEFVERFRREASSAAGLQHQNVVSVYDRGAVGGQLLHRDGAGRGLLAARPDQPRARDRARRSRSPARCSPRRSFAHERGIVHRDLKPLNVLIDRAGRIRVTDFGIARAGNSEITQTGSVMGTAQYLSPEQAQGMRDRRARRHLLDRRDALRDAHRPGPLRGGERRRDRDEAGRRGAARRRARSTRRSRRPSTPSSSRRSPRTRPTASRPPTEMSAALDAAEADPERSPGHTERFAARRRGGGGAARRNRWWVIAADRRAAARRRRARLLPDPPRAGHRARRRPGQERVRGDDRRCRTPASRSTPTGSRTTSPEGTVIEQDPRGGTEAEEGSTVTITVSLGPGTVRVPDVAGLHASRRRSGSSRTPASRSTVERSVRRRASRPAG